jgi:hypothetical protein
MPVQIWQFFRDGCIIIIIIIIIIIDILWFI